MKRFTLLLAFVAIVGFASAQNCCGSATCPHSKQAKDKTMKTLVTYFSASGVTKGAAQELAGIIGADLFEIVPEQRYTDADLDWRDKKSRSTIEMNDKSSRPAIKDGGKVDLSKYDVVYVGFPIVPFATSGGSSIKQACKDLAAAYPKYKFGEGKLLNRIDKADIEKWAGAVK